MKRNRYALYALGFLFALYSALPTYINSSFLNQYIGEALVGMIYTAGSIITLVAFVSVSSMFRRFGDYHVTLGLSGIAFASSLGLAFSTNPFIIFVSFILNFASLSLVGLALDIFLEKSSSEHETGRIRGSFLTWANLAWIIAPLASAVIIGYVAYTGLYALSTLIILPIICIVTLFFRHFKDPHYPKEPYFSHISVLWKERNIKAIFIISFLLQLFYAWMVIYSPIYLHQVIGFDWKTIGLIFSVMLIPFVLIERPLGFLADRYIGEKELLVAGFAILGVSTAATAFLTDHNALLWGALLFVSRIGAATVEIMSETYFFKKVDASRIYLMSFFRMMRPLAYVIGPVIASILFIALDLKGLFVILGLLMLYGIRHSLALRDTK